MLIIDCTFKRFLFEVILLKQKLWDFIKREAVLVIAALCALISILWVPPSEAYWDYLDMQVLCLLFCLMAVIAGLQKYGLFEWLSHRLLAGTVKS